MTVPYLTSTEVAETKIIISKVLLLKKLVKYLVNIMFRSSLSSTELKQYSVPSACTAKFLRNRFCRYFTVRRHSVREYFYCICFLDSSPQKRERFFLLLA